MKVAHAALLPTRALRALVLSSMAWSAMVGVCGGLATASPQGVDTASKPGVRVVERLLIKVEGVVIDPDGQPAEGTTVASSAGGRGIADASGYYCLETRVPRDARCFQITAEGTQGSNLVVTRDVAVPLGSRTAWVDPLTLELATSCVPSWLPTFGGIPGVASATWPGGTVHAAIRYDDGSGEALFIGGSFQVVGGIEASNIAKWDVNTWDPLGSGIQGDVSALAVFNDGTGLTLVAGGSFSVAGGQPVNNVAKWNGVTWVPIGNGVSGPALAITSHDFGNGPTLLVGGNGVHGWNGVSWVPFGSFAAFATVHSLVVHDDGYGSALYAGGTFTSADGNPASRVAKWTGNSWTNMSTGMNGPVYSLAVFDDGFGPQLYAAGAFTNAGFFVVNHVARWDGLNWFPLASGTPETMVNALVVHDNGSGPMLIAACNDEATWWNHFSRLRGWDGQSWSDVGQTFNQSIQTLAIFDEGNGSRLFAGGDFNTVAGQMIYGIARMEGPGWPGCTPLGSGLDRSVYALVRHDDGSGPALFVGGEFLQAGESAARYFAKWDGGNLTPIFGPSYPVHALASYGAGLYVGGGTVNLGELAKWEASGWTYYQNVYGGVRSMITYDDGQGESLYVGGYISSINGVATEKIIKWNGTTWSPLGLGIRGTDPLVLAMAAFDDGNGPTLVVGGIFEVAGLVSASNVAKWNGSSWSRLGSGIDGAVRSLAVYDDGSGPKLYAGGDFSMAGGLPASGIATWDGVQWAPVGGVRGGIQALTVHNDGSGARLYAGGSLYTAGGMSLNSIGSFDGTNWAPLGSGMNFGVSALGSFDFGDGSALYAGGAFTSALDSGDSFLAKWGCPDAVPPTLSCPESLQARDRSTNGPGEIVTFLVTAVDNTDTNPLVVCVPSSGSLFPIGTTAVVCTATDAFGNQSSCTFPVVVTPSYRSSADTPDLR